MKLLSKLSVVVSSALCLSTVLPTVVNAAEQITIWEDLQKGNGIEQAAKDFEKRQA